MQIDIHMAGSEARLALAGSFAFDTHRDFRAAYDTALADPAINTLNIDLTKVEYIDSSALGMLLVLKDRAAAANKTIALSGVQGTVAEVLDVANFGKLFTLRR